MHELDERTTISAPNLDFDPWNRASAVPWGLRVFERGRSEPRDVVIPADEHAFSIGSAPGCSLVIGDVYVSGRHCVVERDDGGGLAVRDRRSKNGTWINGNRIDGATLGIGAMVTVGRTRLLAIGPPRARRRSAMEQLIGSAPCFVRAVEEAVRVGRSECSVLVLGETGTGKELFARLIHEASARVFQPFVAVNCGAIPERLIASELFGHERGAFTGADHERDGVFVQADGGTLFLDEIGELPRPQQPHLLRVLEDRTVRRVGGREVHRVDVRVVSATNRIAGLATDQGAMRRDLFHRLGTVVLDLPPLRERLSDVPVLVRTFLDELAPQFGERRVPRTTMSELRRYTWPGNVRELRSAVQRAVTAPCLELQLDDFLPAWYRARTAPAAEPAPEPVREDVATPDGAEVELGKCDRMMSELILAELERQGSVRAAAAALGMAKSTLSDRIRKYGIQWRAPRRRNGG